MKGRDILKGLVADTTKSETSIKVVPHRTPTVVREMGRSLDKLGEEAAAAKILRETLASGDSVVDLDPTVIEGSFLRDRITTDTEADPEFEKLRQSIQDSGQQVPILVRPHPTQTDNFQVAYGHRRLRAALELHLPVRAVVKALTDEQLILAQGQENGARVDLSFIERALFALRMEARGFDRAKIAAALSVHRPDVIKMLQIAQSIPTEIILAIGPAPKIGRPRWASLAEKLKDDRLRDFALREAAAKNFSQGDTNRRFERLWQVLTEKAPGEGAEVFRTGEGAEIASVIRSKRSGKIIVSSRELTDFLASKMAELIAEFEKG